MKYLGFIIYMFLAVEACSQTTKNEVSEHMNNFQLYYLNEKFEKAAPHYEWLLQHAPSLDSEFYQTGFLLYDQLLLAAKDKTDQLHYQSILDTLETITKQSKAGFYEEKISSIESDDNGNPQENQFDVAPKYEGGMQEFLNWVYRELEKSELIHKKKPKGRCYAMIKLTETGKVSKVFMLEGIKPQIDQEIVNILQTSPDWIPATKNGKPVTMQMVIPINFY